MNIMILGAAGFIGTNLAVQLAKCIGDKITLVDAKYNYFHDAVKNKPNVIIREANFDEKTNFDLLIKNQDVIYHLVSTTAPTTSNQKIAEELNSNVVVTAKLLDSCIRQNVKKVVFISSGGTVYGKNVKCPIKEEAATDPISAYGVQKITIEKLLYLYNYLHGLDYKVIRLANPYGPYQRPNGMLGAVTTFTYKAIKGEKIKVYGDGTVIRDFIYIDDAIKGIINIANSDNENKTYNLGCGYGTSINRLLEILQDTLMISLDVEYIQARKVDVPVNYLDISKYETDFGKLSPIDLQLGIKKTATFMKENREMY